MMTGIKGATPNNPIKLDQSIIKEADSHLDKTDSFGGRRSHLNLTNVIKGSSHDLGTKGSNFDVLKMSNIKILDGNTSILPPTAANSSQNIKLVRTVVGMLKSKAMVNKNSNESLIIGLSSSFSVAKQDELNSKKAINLDFKVVQNNYPEESSTKDQKKKVEL